MIVIRTHKYCVVCSLMCVLTHRPATSSRTKLPTIQIIGRSDAMPSTSASRCAGDDEKFWPFNFNCCEILAVE